MTGVQTCALPISAHEVLLLKDGAVFARGAPDEVIDDAVLSGLYDTPTVVARAPVAGGGCVKVCVPVLDDGGIPARETIRRTEPKMKEA